MYFKRFFLEDNHQQYISMEQFTRTQAQKRKRGRWKSSVSSMRKVPEFLPYDRKKMNHIGSKFNIFLVLGKKLLGNHSNQLSRVIIRIEFQDSLKALVELLFENDEFAQKMQYLHKEKKLQRRLEQYLEEGGDQENKKIVQTFYPVFVKFLYCYKEKRNQYLSWKKELKIINQEQQLQQLQQPLLVQDAQVSETEILVQNDSAYTQPLYDPEDINREPEIKKDVSSTAATNNVQTEMVVEESGCGWQQMQSEESSCQRAIRENWRDVQKKINDKGQDDRDFENYMSRSFWEDI